MESTGSYWIPVKNVLEGSVKIVLVCPGSRSRSEAIRPISGMRGIWRIYTVMGCCGKLSAEPRHRRTARSDAPAKKLQSNLEAEKNRIQKVLEAANVKIGNIISDMFGVSGQAMVSVLISGRESRWSISRI